MLLERALIDINSDCSRFREYYIV